MDTWIVFFEVLSRLLRDYEQMEDNVDERVLHHMCGQMKHYLCGLKSIMEFLKTETESDLTADEIVFIRSVQTSVSQLIDFLCEDAIPSLNNKLDTTVYGEDFINQFKGAAAFVDIDQVCELRSLGFKWIQISRMLGISRVTLYRKRKEAGISEEFKFSSISFEDLQVKVVEIKSQLQDCGERMIMGCLKSQGVFVPRSRLRQAIHAVDPVETTLRWCPRIQRKVYSVPGPMSLWHIGTVIMYLYINVPVAVVMYQVRMVLVTKWSSCAKLVNLTVTIIMYYLHVW